VGVEKLPPEKFAEIKSRQDVLYRIVSGRLDIFDPPNSGCFEEKATFSTPTPDFDNYGVFLRSLRPGLGKPNVKTCQL
jgi:hypothetical protein